MIALHYGGGRRIEFTFAGSLYVVDANRMYTPAGLAASMRKVAPRAQANEVDAASAAEFDAWIDNAEQGVSEAEIDAAEPGVFDPAPLAEAQKYAAQVLSLLAGFPVVVALHNNTNGGWGVRSYLDDPQTASRVFVAPGADPDDFVIVTHADDFDAIAALSAAGQWQGAPGSPLQGQGAPGISCVLQNNVECPDDGSLSVYFRDSPVRYFNCEAEDGEAERQEAMLEGITALLAPA